MITMQPPPAEPNANGYVPRYVSPYGHVAGLRWRMDAHIKRLGERTLPFTGLGLIADLELIMKLLNLREFAEWLRLHGAPEHRQFAEQILADNEEIRNIGYALGHAGEGVGYGAEEEIKELVVTEAKHEQLAAFVDKATGKEFENPLDAVKALKSESDQAAAMRAVLIEYGALAFGDAETDVPGLLRLLLA